MGGEGSSDVAIDEVGEQANFVDAVHIRELNSSALGKGKVYMSHSLSVSADGWSGTRNSVHPAGASGGKATTSDPPCGEEGSASMRGVIRTIYEDVSDKVRKGEKGKT